jgi:hypothetical protein
VVNRSQGMVLSLHVRWRQNTCPIPPFAKSLMYLRKGLIAFSMASLMSTLVRGAEGNSKNDLYAERCTTHSLTQPPRFSLWQAECVTVRSVDVVVYRGGRRRSLNDIDDKYMRFQRQDCVDVPTSAVALTCLKRGGESWKTSESGLSGGNDSSSGNLMFCSQPMYSGGGVDVV